MELDNNILAQIDAYLEGEMSAEEQLAFEERIASDQELAEQVEEIRLTNDAIYFAGLSELREKVGMDIQKIDHKDSSNNWKLPSILLGGVVLVGYMLLSTNESTDEQTIEVTRESITETKDDNVVVDNKVKSSDRGVVDNNKKPKPINRKEEGVEAEVLITEFDTVEFVNDKEINDTENSNTIIPVNNKEPRESESKPKQNVTTDVSPCQRDYEVKILKTCQGEATGEVVVNSLTSDIELVTLGGRESTSGHYYELEKGNYNLSVKYSSTCVFDQDIVLEDKWCPRNSSYSFNPRYEEAWRPILNEDDKGTVIIYNRRGQEIKAFSIEESDVEWNGTTNDGEFVETGVYIAVISYADGRKEKLEITIVR